MIEPVVLYLAHPVAPRDGFTVDDNLANARAWLSWFVAYCPDVALECSWIGYVQALGERPDTRPRGIRDQRAIVRRCEGILLTGGTVSPGMGGEADVNGPRPRCDLTDLGRSPPLLPTWIEHRVALARIAATISQCLLERRPA